MRNNLLLGVALAALTIPGAAFAQSTGTLDAENDVVVKGTRHKEIAGTEIPDTPKTRVVLTQALISHQVSGQSVDEIINQLPGVSFQNNDPYGSSGGRLTIRGFGPDRISQTLDGFPTNDTGNYAVYSNQLVDPELIDQVNVSLGSTDIDSPTASASGSTVNMHTMTPTDGFGARVSGSYGDLNFFRMFGVVNTGVFTPFGTKAWFSASHASNDVVFSHYGEIDKTSYNFKVYQPLRDNGDFISLAGNWNRNRNNNTPDYALENFTTGTTANIVPNRIPLTKAERFFNSAQCQTVAGTNGVADQPNTCGTAYEQNVNPSDTGSLRLNSRYTITNKLVFTLDGAFQYTKANGGSYGVKASEGASPTGNYGLVTTTNSATSTTTGYYTGVDLNHDGDKLDTVELDGTSQTVTHRYAMTASLRYDMTEGQSFRVSYAHDYGRHRQTGELGYLLQNGQPVNVFPIDAAIKAANGYTLEKRDRLSYAVLDQFSGEYRGKFLNDQLTIIAGVRVPFLKRNLQQNCFTTTAAGGVSCVAGSSTDIAAYAAAHPYSYTAATATKGAIVTGYAVPAFRQFTYNRALPSAGLTYSFAGGFQIYGNYSKGIQVPGTDNLYQAFFYPAGAQNPKPETTDNFDAGLRYTSSKIQAFAGPWYTIFKNRLASSYDPINDITTYVNLGKVTKYGVDASIAYQPIPQLSLYAYGSYLKSKIDGNVVGGACTTALIGSFGCSAANVGSNYYFQTAGKRESGAPVSMFGARAQLDLKSFEIGLQAKRTGKRYVNDQNVPIYTSNAATTVLYGATAAAYTIVDLDARLSMGFLGLNDKTYLQLNVTNLFDTMYIGNLGAANTSYTSVPFVYIGSPRTVSGTINVAF